MHPPKTGQSDFELFRKQLVNMIAMDRDLVKLAGRIDWSRFDASFGRFYHDRRGRPGLSTRKMVGLHMLKHVEGLSDEDVCRRWLDNPYYQYFTGETHFQHKRTFDPSLMSRWRQCIGPEELERILAEELQVARQSSS